MEIELNAHATQATLEFTLDPPVSEWQAASATEVSSHAKYEADGYILDIAADRDQDHTLFEFHLRRASGEAFTISQYVVKTESSSAGLDRVWLPWHLNWFIEPHGLFPHSVRDTHSRHRQLGEVHRTMADRRIPIAIGMDRDGATVHAFGFLDQRIETDIQYRTMTHYASGLQQRARCVTSCCGQLTAIPSAP